jgi:hypothetical protein
MKADKVINFKEMMKVFGGRGPREWSHGETKEFVEAVNTFFASPVIRDMDGKTAQALEALLRGEKGFNTPGATGTTPNTQTIDPYMLEAYITGTTGPERGYERIFDLVDMRGTKKDHFDIDSASDGITWQQTLPGEKVEIHTVNDKQVDMTVKYLQFRAGVGLLDEYFQFEQFWTIESILTQFRLKEDMRRARLMYGLIELLTDDTVANGGINMTWDANLVTTINNAMVDIANFLEDQGYGLPENPEFVILTRPEYNQAISYALDAVQYPYGKVEMKAAKLNYSIRDIITTRRLATNGKFFVCLPGYKNKYGVWMDLQIEQARDVYKGAQDIVGKVQYNGGIGNKHQFRRIPVAA